MAPDVAAFRGKVRAEVDPDLPVGAARVSVRTRSGSILTAEVTHARGSLEAPLTDAEIEAKLRDCARQGASDCDVDRIIDEVWNLDKAPTVRRLMSLARARR
jgi:2-methylcitrate dehydratase PrpD